MLTIEHPGGSYRMEPGVYRYDPRHEVVVGRHQPPSSTAVLRFMEYFSDHFRLEKIGRSQRIIAIAVAHHRFNYIHPFPDGNGRVSRLLSHAMALVTGIGAHGLWSISRGLARGLEDRGEYLIMMNNTDAERRGDTDGRGNLSLQALVEFIEWFCKVCLDQLQFMATLFDFERLRDRLSRYAIDELGLHPGSEVLLETILRSGELARSDAARVIGTGERNARNVLSALTSAGLLASATPKGPVALRFDSTSAESLFPRLFPARAD